MAGDGCMDEGRVLVLLGTSGCHLCDKAEALLAQAAAARAFTWRYHDIALEDPLVSQYGERIDLPHDGDGQTKCANTGQTYELLNGSLGLKGTGHAS